MKSSFYIVLNLNVSQKGLLGIFGFPIKFFGVWFIFCNGRPTGCYFIIYCLINVDSLGYKREKFWRISLGFLSLSRVLQSLNTKLESNRPRYKRKEKNHDIYSWFWVSLHDQRVKPFFCEDKTHAWLLQSQYYQSLSFTSISSQTEFQKQSFSQGFHLDDLFLIKILNSLNGWIIIYTQLFNKPLFVSNTSLKPRNFCLVKFC